MEKGSTSASRAYILTLFALIALCTVLTLQLSQAWLGYDPLASPFVNGHLVQIDSWSIVHTVTFILCGYAHPGRMPIFMLTGIIWEVLEYFLAANWNRGFWNELAANIFWDLWFNLLGYRIGESIFRVC
eukprot:CAMPEP_0119135242 /NCGR_PEP_ID=MMETSP1310-20130426/18920_1 /TAXON_ID=464262 /ORGANISM="Genus nov. species nov., Strain RCC2339" /LENGTH=128 /DNA_ID=CAMNT_0007126109 /DNA_START=1 /DNA_END=387 /DNA_ORIENTATION=-